MPLYPYLCTQCSHRFEKIQKFGAKPEQACPKCGGPLERPLTAPGLQFKGAGWYVNDYAAKGGNNSAVASAPAGDKSESAAATPPASSASSPAAASAPAAPAGSSSN